MFQFWISFGSLIGSVIVNATSTIMSKQCYIIPLGVLFVVPAVLSLGLIFLPESPRYLMYTGSEEAARHNMRRLRGPQFTDVMIEEEIAEMRQSIDMQKQMAKSVKVLDMFRGTDLRRTVLSVCTVACQAASGSMFLIAYGTVFFQRTGSTTPFRDSVILTCMGIVGCVASMFYVRYIARRTLMIIGPLAMASCMFIIAAVNQALPGSPSAGKCVLAFVVLYIAIYTGTVSPFSWTIGGEIPSQRLRSITLGLSAAVGFLGAWLISFTVPLFITPGNSSYLGTNYCYIWGGSNVCIAIFAYFCLPVTDRTLEELDYMFRHRVPARKFKSYVCADLLHAREEVLLSEKQQPTYTETSA